MKEKLVLCLLFFCVLCFTGCEKELEKELERKQEEIETITDIKAILVLTDGENETAAAAEIICEKMKASYYDVSITPKEEVRAAVEDADYVLIGTKKDVGDFETVIKGCLEAESLEDKKVSLFLLDREEEKEEIVTAFSRWYPDADVLPAFSMLTDKEMLEEELGRMNGWLTTVFTYDIETE